SFRTKDEVECLADGRFSDVVAAHKKRVAAKIYAPLRDASEIADFQPSNAHMSPPFPATKSSLSRRRASNKMRSATLSHWVSARLDETRPAGLCLVINGSWPPVRGTCSVFATGGR